MADDCREPEYDALLTPPTPLHVAFTDLCNKVPKREVTEIARDLLVSARLNMVPEEGQKYRPIRIECAMSDKSRS